MKGIAPLIATVLLVVIAISVSAVLFSQFARQTGEPLDSAKGHTTNIVDCAQKQLRILSADSSNGQLFVTVQNTGQKALTDLLMYANTPEGVNPVSYTLQGTLDTGSTFKLVNSSFPYAFTDSIYLASPVCGNVKHEKNVSRQSPQLIGWWTFDEGSGTSAQDSSGKGNTASLYSAGSGDPYPLWVPARLGTGIQFDGVNDTVTVSTATFATIVGDKTIEVWANLTAIDSSGGAIFAAKNFPAFGDIGYLFGVNASRNLFFTVSNTTAEEMVAAATQLPLNEWHHLVAAYDADVRQVTLYIDGALVKTGSFSFLHSAGPRAYIGGEDSSPHTNGGHETGWIGVLDNLRFYNRTLTSPEIKALADGWRPV